MDLMTIIGTLFAFAVLFFGIAFDKNAGLVMTNFGNFFDVPSLIIVIGGVVAALMLSFPIKIFTKIPKHIKICLMPKKYIPQEYIMQIVDLATEARINGLLSLETKLEETSDTFLKNSMMLVVDAVDPEKVKTLLETELDYLDERHAQDRAFYDKGASYGPAYGMIGTLMGLINLLKQLDDPSKVAPAMAVALVTTFYGSILANMMFLPISNKLKVRHEEEYLCKMIVAEGVQAIQAGNNPKFIQEKLTQLIPGYLASKMEGASSSGGGGGDDGGKKKGKKK